ncbi:tail terminator [Gordonia phage Vasanti]|uniref:Tail terminator n=1 Tax=Gordonia phage Vasanti TaxID=2502431 RepID=A0A411BVX7_9CAUD|nr:head-tail connector protein [Gordonia phage Vasanti]QAY05749.1 tail terminator [Gordonia phage Vasanti]
MAFTTSSEVIEALGRKMAALNLVRYLDDPDAVFGDDDPSRLAYIAGLLPPDPDTCVSAVVTRDDRERDPYNPDIDVRLRFRAAAGATKTADDWADDTFTALHVPDHVARKEMWPGGVRVLDVRRVMRALSFEDSNGRTVRADDYRITLNPRSE